MNRQNYCAAAQKRKEYIIDAFDLEGRQRKDDL